MRRTVMLLAIIATLIVSVRNLPQQTRLGVGTVHAQVMALPTAPSTWTVWSFVQSSNSIKATATKAAGGSGVRHVATCVSVKWAALNNAGGNMTASLRDGPSGTGPTLAIWFLSNTANTTAQTDLCDLNIVGSANTPMTLEFTSPSSTSSESVTLVGYDAM